MPELAGDVDQEVVAHGRQCAACAGGLANQRMLISGLRELAADERQVKAPNRVESRLLAAFRGQAGLAMLPTARPWWAPLATWAAAIAVVALAILLFVARGRLAEAPPQYPIAGAESTLAEWAATLADEDLEFADAGFIELPNASRLAPTEDVNLVRIEVPRSAMIALGFPVTADRAAERVRADVVLGSDGLARAVRFLDD